MGWAAEGVRKRTDRERKEDKEEMQYAVNTLIKYSLYGKYPVFVTHCRRWSHEIRLFEVMGALLVYFRFTSSS